MNKSNIRGRLGEDITAMYLQRAGFDILCRNYRTKGGETDIIAANGEFIVFVEVKTRDISAFERGEFAVTKQKQQRLIRCAEAYLRSNPCELQPRFDVAVVTIKNNRLYRFDYYDNSF